MKFLPFLFISFLFASHTQAQLKINEVLYDPSNTALEGDANGDGSYNQTEDEFIEFVNTGTTDLDASRYKIFDKVKASGLKTRRHTMPDSLMVPPNGAVVVFGGGTAVGSFGGALVVVDVGTVGLSLANTGEMVILEDSLGNVLDSMDTDALSNDPNESYTRNPDLTGDFVQHASVTPGKLFSPGTRVDGSPFNTVLSGKVDRPGFSGQVFPNPVVNRLYFSGDKSQIKAIDLIDVHGKIWKSVSSGFDFMDVQGLSAGQYMLRIDSGNGFTYRKFIRTN